MLQWQEKNPVDDFGLYVVMTNPELGYRRFTEICVEEEVPIIQLRDKSMPNLDLVLLAKELKGITSNTNTHFFVNDRVDHAILADADGVHLGPQDVSWQEARRLLPKQKLIGVSTHSIAEAELLIRQISEPGNPKAPDYMSFGPIYPTVAKKIPDPPVGTEQLARIMEIAPLPVVAIGGLFPHNISEVFQAGARNIAMIRHLGDSVCPGELREKIQQLRQIIRSKK